jgi:hypothetical protein
VRLYRTGSKRQGTEETENGWFQQEVREFIEDNFHALAEQELGRAAIPLHANKE